MDLTIVERRQLLFKKRFHDSLAALNRELFTAFVKESLTLEQALRQLGHAREFPLHDKDFNRKYIKRMYHKYQDKTEKKVRTDGYDTRHKDPTDVILSRFIINGSDYAFLPQIKIAALLKCNQKTISRYIAKMVKNGLIKLEKRYIHFERKACEYSLTSKGLDRVKTLTPSYIYDRILLQMVEYTRSIMDFGNVSKEKQTVEASGTEQKMYDITSSLRNLAFDKKIYQTKRWNGNVSLYAPDGGLANVGKDIKHN